MNLAIVVPVICIIVLMFCNVPVWIAMFADWIVRSVFFVIRFLMGKWQKKTVI